MEKRGYRDLLVWQKAKNLSVIVYKETQNGAISRDYGLKDQIRRSAVSIASNVAEGDGLGKGSDGEVFIVEAKANLPEIASPPSGAGEKS